ncbi:MAG TPA: cytochrome c biogenesis protein CcdA [Chloroflexia bacterium]|nr:cytochrome c biogenesis protein CcdA [Chloroflexia bacterium]
MNESNANIFVAVLAGFLSFASPCVLPLVPTYLAYMTGASVEKGTQRVQAARWKVFLHALAFVAGFSLIFVLLGISAGALSEWLLDYRQQLQVVLGLLLIIFGVHTLRPFQIPFFYYENRLGDHFRPAANLGYFRSFLIGTGFALGWTPCVGPFLGLLYTMAMAQRTAEAVPLFVAYSLGLGIPFILAALLAGQLTIWLRKIMMRTFDLRVAGRTLLANLNPISLLSGVLLLFMGVLLVLDRVTWLNGLMPQWQIGI